MIGQEPPSVTKPAIALAAFALFAVLLLLGLEQWTADERNTSERAFAQARISTLMPPGTLDEDPFAEAVALPGYTHIQQLQAKVQGRVERIIWSGVSAPDGYSGPIDLAVAFAPSGTVVGVEVLRHRETPGLGDAIERRRGPWLQQFEGMSENSALRLRAAGGEIDGITSATITARAVAGAVRGAHAMFIGRTLPEREASP